VSHSFNPEMLILARETRGITQSDLAEAASISQGNISKYESGALAVSEEHAQKIADVLNYPVSFFYQSGELYGFGSHCTYFRKRQTMPVQELRVLKAKLNRLRIHVARLLNGVELEQENKFPRLDIDDYDGDVERIAQIVRQTWRLPLGPIKNLFRAVESAGGIVVRQSFGTNKLDAISQCVPGLPPVFLINADMPGERIRFTLAHEIGHIIMHQLPTDDEVIEKEADRFAAEFLMPSLDIAPDLTSLTFPKLARLKAYWKVSMAALIRRAYDTGKITSRQYRSLNAQLSKNGYRTNEPNPIAVEEPTIFNAMIEVYFNELKYDLSDLSQLLALHEHEFRAEYLHVNRTLRIVGGANVS
jgi:Zn-dependent peptidase ImmA (M78 family)/transcriptional regulator with XRE-family HTH domain